jgi:undecaprenyl-diphosphatase
MDSLQAIIMGIVQGVAEFLPISSSAHLVLTPWFFGWKDPGLAFDVALHWGTLIALVLFFWRDWVDMIGAAGKCVLKREGDEQKARLLLLIVIATVPGLIAGALLESQAESTFRSPWLVGAVMGGFGLVMLLAERLGKRTGGMGGIGYLIALCIGVCQAFAIIPGVSRAGVTMTSGLFFNLRRESAARFSFLLAMPIIAGASFKAAYDLVQTGIPAGDRLPFLLGVLTAALVGYFSISWLLRFLQAKTFVPFVIYRVLLSVVVFALLVSGLR